MYFYDGKDTDMGKNKIVLNALKYALFGVKDFIPGDTDWSEIYKELRIQTVQNLICPICGELPGFTEENRQCWINSARVSVSSYFKILKAQQNTVELLRKNDIRSVVLKGTAAAMYYPYPEYRTMGDIDLLIEQGRAKEAAELLLENGYDISIPLELSSRHYNLKKDGTEFELHMHFSSFENSELSKYLDEILFNAMDDIRTAESYNYKFPVFPSLENGVVLLCHINHHLQGGLGLRQVCDWIMYVSRVLDDKFWNQYFQPVASRLRLEKMAVTFAHIGQMYLGLPKENYTWCLRADEELCDKILDFVFRSGNFGGNKDNLIHIDNTFISLKKQNIFSLLQERGELNFAGTISKHPWIKPFIWIPQSFRTAGRGLHVFKHVNNLSRSRKEVEDRLILMKKIGRQD